MRFSRSGRGPAVPALRFAKTPDYESAKGGESPTFTNTYVVDVQATDETRRTETETVTVNVTNVDEDGTVELSALRPQSATAFTATLDDPDGAISNAKWQWSKSSSKNGAYSPIDEGHVGHLYAEGRRHWFLPAGDGHLHGPGG